MSAAFFIFIHFNIFSIVEKVFLKILIDQVSQKMIIIYHYIDNITENVIQWHQKIPSQEVYLKLYLADRGKARVSCTNTAVIY